MSIKIIDRGIDWTICINDEGRTAFPFISEVRENGRINHPYIDLSLKPDLVDSVPEVLEFPQLGNILKSVNSATSNLRSTQCNVGIIKCDPAKANGYSYGAGALIHIIFREHDLNLDQGKLLQLARIIEQNIQRPSAHPFRILLTIEPYKNWHGRMNSGHFGLAIEFVGNGVDEFSAKEAAKAGAEALANALIKIDQDNLIQQIVLKEID